MLRIIIPFILVNIWLSVVSAALGFAAAAACGLSMLVVGLVGIWEAAYVEQQKERE